AGFGYVRFVPAGSLGAFTRELRSDPVPGLSVPPGPLSLLPSGRRAYYCLARLGVLTGLNQYLVAPGVDYCSIPGFSSFSVARDAGRFVTLTVGGHLVVGVAPLYRGGVVPATPGTRRRQSLGGVVGLFDVHQI